MSAPAFDPQEVPDNAPSEPPALAPRLSLEDLQKIVESEEQYRTLFDSVDVGFCIVTILFDGEQTPYDYRFVNSNPAFERHTGLVDVIGKTIQELVPGIDPSWFRIYGNVALTGQPVRFENHDPALRRRFDVYALRLGPPENHQVGILFTDITIRKEAEEALRKSEEQLRDAQARLEAALSAGEIATWTFDIVNNRVVADANLARLFSVNPDEAAGGRLEVYLEAIHPEDRAQVTATIGDAIAHHDDFESEYRVILPDGSFRWLIARGKVARDENGNALSLPGVILDITTRKQALEALREQGEYLRRLVENSTDCITTLDLNGHLLSMNAGGQEVMQIDNFAAVRGIDWPTLWKNEETHRIVEGALQSARAGERTHFQGFCPTFKGEARWWDVVMVPLFGADNQPEQVLAVSRDVTFEHEAVERQRFLSELTERARRLNDPDQVIEETLRSVGEFLGLSRYLYADVDEAAEVIFVHRDWNNARQGVVSAEGRWDFDNWIRNIAPLGVTRDELRGGNIGIIRDFAVDLRTAQEYDALIPHTASRRMRAVVRVPLYRGGRWVAMLSAQSLEPRDWSAEEVALLETVAERTWLTLENLRLLREAQAQTQTQRIRAEREALLNQIGVAVRSTLEPDAILQAAVSTLGQGLGADRCYFVRYNQTRDTARVSPEWSRPEVGIEPLGGRTLQMSSFSVDRDPAYRAGRTHVVDDVVAYAPEDVGPLQSVHIRAVLRVPIEGGDQMTALSVAMAHAPRHWTEDEVHLVETVAGMVRSALDSAHIQQRERNIARHLQEALLPPLPPDLPGLSLWTFYRPALQEAGVGGDGFDVFAVEEKCTALCVFDLSGKGLKAASAVATVRNMARFAFYNSLTIEGAIAMLNRTLVEYGLLEGFATFFLGAYDHETKELTYVNCGQEPALIWRAATGAVDYLPPTGPVLGGFIEGTFSEEVVALLPGDVFYCGTDGMTEVGASRRKFLEIDGLAALFERCVAEAVADARTEANDRVAHTDKDLAAGVVSRLIAGVEAQAGGAAGIRDDIALLVGVVGDSGLAT